MRMILQSPYLTYEYMYWRIFNYPEEVSSKEIQNIIQSSTEGIEPMTVASFEGYSRNLIIKIGFKNETLYYLKQYGSNSPKSYKPYIPNEYEVLQKLNGQPFLVKTFFYDPDNQILATESWGKSNLKDALKVKGADLATLVTQATIALAKIHLLSNTEIQVPKPKSKYILKVDLPEEKIGERLQADLDFLWCNDNWSQNTLIHFDPRDVNFLIDENDTRIIDWEMAIYGDPMWDLAVFINSIIVTVGGDGFYSYPNIYNLGKVKDLVSAICTSYQSLTNGANHFNKTKLVTFLRLQNIQLYDRANYFTRFNSIIT